MTDAQRPEYTWYYEKSRSWGHCIRVKGDLFKNLIGGYEDRYVAFKLHTEAEARRIVACVNACAGIDIRTLEFLTKPGDLEDYFRENFLTAEGYLP